MRPYDWYTRAKERVERLLPSLDENLEVEIETTVVTPYDEGDEYETFALAFSHSSNPNLSWTMEVRMDDEYIEHELAQVVTDIYLERVE